MDDKELFRTQSDLESQELARLRAEIEALRRERDGYRDDLSRTRATQTAQATAELQILSTKLEKEIKEGFYSFVSRMLWVAAVLIGVATLGGYLRLDDIIEHKIDDRVAEKRRQMEAEIEASLTGFKRKADEALRELGERTEAVRAESDSAITRIRTRMLDVTLVPTAGVTTVTAAQWDPQWDPWFGRVPDRFVGIAGSGWNQIGYENAIGATVFGAFSEQFRAALTAADTDGNGDGKVSWEEAVKRAAVGLRPKFPQDPVIVGAPQTSTASALRSSPETGRRGTLRALLVGINDYEGVNDLSGPVNDVKQFEALLKTHRLADTAAANVKVLTDRDATAAAIMSSLSERVTGAAEDDVVLLYFSGHVSSLPDGASPTGRVKAIAPSDALRSNVSAAQKAKGTVGAPGAPVLTPIGDRLLRAPELVRTITKGTARLAVLIVDG